MLPPDTPPPLGSPPWFNQQRYTLTGFKLDVVNQYNVVSGAINSVPRSPWNPSPLRHTYLVPAVYKVVGNVTAPAGDSVDQDSLTVAVYPAPPPPPRPTACFTHSGMAQVGSSLTFDGSCSTGSGALEYLWSFGDNSPPAGWSADSIVVHHTYTTAGPYTVTLAVLDQSTSLQDDTSVTLGILPAETLSVSIHGTNDIVTSGTYAWMTLAGGGQSPYHYQWYYQPEGENEVPVGSDSTWYSRYVTTGPTVYHFTLRVAVKDAVQDSAQALCYVQVEAGTSGPLIVRTCPGHPQ